jgi:hypothetical protein
MPTPPRVQITLTNAEKRHVTAVLCCIAPIDKRSSRRRSSQEVAAEFRARVAALRPGQLRAATQRGLIAGSDQAIVNRLHRNPAYATAVTAAKGRRRDVLARAKSAGVLTRTASCRRTLHAIEAEVEGVGAPTQLRRPRLDAPRLRAAHEAHAARARARASANKDAPRELVVHFRGNDLDTPTQRKAALARLQAHDTVAVRLTRLARLETRGGPEIVVRFLAAARVVGVNVDGLHTNAASATMRALACGVAAGAAVRKYYFDETYVPKSCRGPLREALKLARRMDINERDRPGARWLHLADDEWAALTEAKCDMGELSKTLSLRAYALRKTARHPQALRKTARHPQVRLGARRPTYPTRN